MNSSGEILKKLFLSFNKGERDEFIQVEVLKYVMNGMISRNSQIGHFRQDIQTSYN